MKASEAKFMADNFHTNDLMPESVIYARLNSLLKRIKGHAEIGRYKMYENVDSQWRTLDEYNDKQKKHGRKELKKRLQDLVYKVKSDGFFSLASVSWK